MILLVASAWAGVLEVREGESIQAAIEVAETGDVVLVYPGTYPGGVDFLGKDIRVVAAEGPEQTVLDGDDVWDQAVVQLVSGEPLSAELRGFTVREGHGVSVTWDVGTGWMGGGVHVRDANATVTDCVFEGNLARHSGQSMGGGVAVIRGTLRLVDNRFVDNLGSYGGGAVAVVESQAWLEGNRFEGNVGNHGGALAVVQGSTVDLVGNRFSGNEGGYGGALYLKDSTLSSVGDHFDANHAWRNGGAAVLSASRALFSEARFEDSAADFDGGAFWVGHGSTLQLDASALREGRALVGSAVAVRGASLGLEGVLVEGGEGVALWLGEADALLVNVTLKDCEAGVAQVLDGSLSGLNTILVGAGEAPALELHSGSVGWSWGLLAWEGELVGGELQALDGEGLLQVDPLLDAEGRPLAGSPAVDAGHPAWKDLDGSRSDLGATGGRRPWSP